MTAVTPCVSGSLVLSTREMTSNSSIGTITAALKEQTQELAKHKPPLQTWRGRKARVLPPGHSDAATVQNADSTSRHIQALNLILDEIEKLGTLFEEVIRGSQVVRREEVDQVLGAVNAAKEMGERYLISHHETLLKQQRVVSLQEPFVLSVIPPQSPTSRMKWLKILKSGS